mmetsp:Transcript_8599/g.6083  ORF Transcript_8599/g.6083 Transcript_8599/m.6083 type:complete len:85 (+) Transcript_8599:113-367(+)
MLMAQIRKHNKQSSRENRNSDNADMPKKKGGKGNVDKEFFERIKQLIKIVIPRTDCQESRYIVVLSVLLVVRTYLSIWLADVNG